MSAEESRGHTHEGHETERDTGTQPRRPGHELGAARKRADISIEEMASRLHLRQQQVEAIERDDYQHLPTATFVRGYLRAYAKEVGMDGDQMVAEFDATHDRADDPELILSEGVADETPAGGPLMILLVIVAVALVGAAVWWYQQQAPAPPAPIEDTLPEGEPATGAVQPDAGEAAAPTVDTADGAAIVDEGFDTGTEAGTDAGVETEAMAEAGDGNAAAGDTTVAAGEEPAGTGNAGEAEVTAEMDAAGGDNGAVEPAATTDATATEPATTAEADVEGPLATSDAEEAATTAAATGPDRVTLEVDGVSWIEVYDDRGRRLAYTLYSGSTPVVLNGWAPFDIFLGNSPVVTVRVDGTTVDQSAFVRSDNTARFLADGEGASRR